MTGDAAGSLQMSGSADHPSTIAGQYRATPPTWSSTPEDRASLRSSSHSNGKASQELRGGGPSQSTSQDQSQGKNRIPLLSSQEEVYRGDTSSRPTSATQPKEVMFQSLRPTSIETQTGQEDNMFVTPLITLGTMTPSVDIGGGRGGGLKSLSSFAASPTLRKRSSQASTSQRSTSSGSNFKSRPDAAGQSQSPSKSILSPGAAASQGSHHTEANSSTDFFDDIQLDDTFDDLETMASPVTLPSKRSAPSDSPVTSRPRPPPPSANPSAPVSAPPRLPPPATIHDEGNEDDLEFLLDGFDGSDLYDI